MGDLVGAGQWSALISDGADRQVFRRVVHGITREDRDGRRHSGYDAEDVGVGVFKNDPRAEAAPCCVGGEGVVRPVAWCGWAVRGVPADAASPGSGVWKLSVPRMSVRCSETQVDHWEGR